VHIETTMDNKLVDKRTGR